VGAACLIELLPLLLGHHLLDLGLGDVNNLHLLLGSHALLHHLLLGSHLLASHGHAAHASAALLAHHGLDLLGREIDNLVLAGLHKTAKQANQHEKEKTKQHPHTIAHRARSPKI